MQRVKEAYLNRSDYAFPVNIAGGEMQNIHPVIQPYLETLSMFSNFEEKKGKKNLIVITNQKTWGFF